MPQRAKGTRLWLRRRPGRDPVWVIKDGAREISTGCGERGIGDAEQALSAYITGKFSPDIGQRDPAKIPIAEVLAMYARNFAIHHACPELVKYHGKALMAFWGDMHLTDVRGTTCRRYVEKRVAEGRKPETARRELETLQAAIRRWHKESPLDAVPSVTMPPKGVPRERFLERWEAAALLRAARRLGHNHIVRFILIGLYTGTRHNAILSLRWLPGLTGGYIDLERQTLFRRGRAEQETSKRRPPMRIGLRLLSHLRRWAATDAERGVAHVVNYRGKAIKKERRAWSAAVAGAGLGEDVTPHVLRHTFITWAMWSGKDIWTVAGEAGTSALMIERVYGHHRDAGAKHGPERRISNAG